jgi:hypothetical protein
MENNNNEERFNSGNLKKDIQEIDDEIHKLTHLKNNKMMLKQQNEANEREQIKKNNTINKVNQMISEGVQVKYERSTCLDYIFNSYGLKSFYISLDISYNSIYSNSWNYVNFSSEYMQDKMRDNIDKENNYFGKITSVSQYNFKKFNVTQTEYEHTLFFLQNLLPINVTISINNYGLITFKTGYDFIWLDSAGHAYISGVSLTHT